MDNLLLKSLDWIKLAMLSTRIQFGQKYWILLISVLLWPLLQGLRLKTGLRSNSFGEEEIQNFIIGFPLYCLAIGIGVRIIAHEIEQRTLEVAYTVPGGSRRIWLSKLVSATALIICVEIMLSIFSLLFASLDFHVYYGTFQGAIFYLILAMWLGALVKNELAATLLCIGIGYISLKMTSSRWSPLFNPLESPDISRSELIAWSIQNHVGFALLIVTMAALGFASAERRERLLKE